MEDKKKLPTYNVYLEAKTGVVYTYTCQALSKRSAILEAMNNFAKKEENLPYEYVTVETKLVEDDNLSIDLKEPESSCIKE